MKQITSIAFSSLRNAEFLGVHNEGLKFAKTITDKDVLPLVNNYEKALTELKSFLEASVFETKDRLASQQDVVRNNVYASCRKVAKAVKDYPDESARETGELIWKVFSENPNPIHINQQQATGVLINIISGIKNFGDERLEACGFKIWLDKLEEVNNLFVEADMARYSERGQRELECCKRLRAAVVETFKLVSMAATVRASSGSESCRQFIDCMNATVAAKKLQVCIRKERPKQGAGPETVQPGNALSNAA